MNYTLTVYRGMEEINGCAYDTRYDLAEGFNAHKKLYPGPEYSISVTAHVGFNFTIVETETLTGKEAQEKVWKMITDWKQEHGLLTY